VLLLGVGAEQITVGREPVAIGERSNPSVDDAPSTPGRPGHHKTCRRLEHPSNGLLESGHVTESELDRDVAITIGDRLEEVGVTADVLGQVRQLVDHQASDPGGEVVVANEDVLQMRVAGGSLNESVDGHILAEEGGAVAGEELEVADLVGPGAHLSAHLGGGVLGGSAGRMRLQKLSDVRDRP
jgi:hypothetical protein